MKNSIQIINAILGLTFLIFFTNASAQSPNKMSYQAVVRNASNVLVGNASVGLQISILQTTTTGTAVYVERHTTITNVNGLATIEIGSGSVVSGNFGTINWSNGPFFIKTETDPNGGTTYTISGTSQLLSVPFALFAATSGDMANAWSVQGNASQLNDFIGSTNSVSLKFRTNNLERMRIATTSGNVGINTIGASEKLDVNGNIKLSGAFMPNNIAGNTDQVLLSSGAGVAPVWSPFKFGNVTGTTEISKYFSFLTITTPWLANTQRQFKIAAPYIRVDSAVSLTFRGSPYSPAIHDNLIIYNVIATPGELLITTFNKGATINGSVASPSQIPIAVMGMF